MTISMRRASINLAEAVRAYTDGEIGTDKMGPIVEAIDALPLPFDFRVRVYDLVLPCENEIQGPEDGTDADYLAAVRAGIVESIGICFQIRRDEAKAKEGGQPFAPDFDFDRFKAHALSEGADAKWAYNKAQHS